jgi:hypothetical protein
MTNETKTWKNELEETISNKEIDEITQRIIKLTPKELDLLWHRCGYILSDRDFHHNALSQSYISKIKSGEKVAKTLVEALLLETPKKEVLKHLDKIEKLHTH